MPIFSNSGRIWAFITASFSENEVSNIKLCILIKSWTQRAWGTKLDFQMPGGKPVGSAAVFCSWAFHNLSVQKSCSLWSWKDSLV